MLEQKTINTLADIKKNGRQLLLFDTKIKSETKDRWFTDKYGQKVWIWDWVQVETAWAGSHYVYNVKMTEVCTVSAQNNDIKAWARLERLHVLLVDLKGHIIDKKEYPEHYVLRDYNIYYRQHRAENYDIRYMGA